MLLALMDDVNYLKCFGFTPGESVGTAVRFVVKVLRGF